MIIGISGYARSGKDTVAQVLVDEFGFTRVAFADKLRDFLYTLDPIILWDYNFDPMSPYPNHIPLKYIIDTWGWDGYKETGWARHIRKYLQRLGTECGRELIDDNIWVNAAFNIDNIDSENLVVTDVRFLNEADAIKRRGGEIWRISRSDVGPINDHISETGLDGYEFDRVLWNGGDGLDKFRKVVREFALDLTTTG